MSTQFVFANFMSRIQVDWNTYCWNWTRCKDKHGYGRLRFEGRNVLPHRLSKYLYGEMSRKDFLNPKRVVMHICDNPSCLNPQHLKVGSQQDNIRDRVTKERTASHRENRCACGRFINKKKEIKRA